MISFLLKGLFRDRQRSLFPFIVVTLGVFFTVLIHCWINGVMGDMVDSNARFSTGHVKIVTRAYAENMDQMPNDLALLGVESLFDSLRAEYPDMIWTPRIRFGGLLDAPDEQGETRNQGPVMGWAVDLRSGARGEIERLNIENALTRGRMPERAGEILISDSLSQRLEVEPGDLLTLLGSTMYGGMAMANYTLAGTVQFGIAAMDRGAMILDISDAQRVLDMEDSAGEILGYFPDRAYHHQKAAEMAREFNSLYSDRGDEFSPVMLPLKAQNDLAGMLDYVAAMIGIMIGVFVLVMSIVLWNAGLIGGLRRYTEIGIRLAIGEGKGHVYRSMVGEAVLIGLFGSVAGTAIGVALAYVIQIHGLQVGDLLQNATIMMPNVYRTVVTPPAFFIGFAPGFLATVLGTALSGIGIYRRQTAQLFKELEA